MSTSITPQVYPLSLLSRDPTLFQQHYFVIAEGGALSSHGEDELASREHARLNGYDENDGDDLSLTGSEADLNEVDDRRLLSLIQQNTEFKNISVGQIVQVIHEAARSSVGLLALFSLSLSLSLSFSLSLSLTLSLSLPLILSLSLTLPLSLFPIHLKRNTSLSLYLSLSLSFVALSILERALSLSLSLSLFFLFLIFRFSLFLPRETATSKLSLSLSLSLSLYHVFS